MSDSGVSARCARTAPASWRAASMAFRRVVSRPRLIRILERADGRSRPIAVRTREGSLWPVLQADQVERARAGSFSMSSSASMPGIARLRFPGSLRAGVPLTRMSGMAWRSRARALALAEPDPGRRVAEDHARLLRPSEQGPQRGDSRASFMAVQARNVGQDVVAVTSRPDGHSVPTGPQARAGRRAGRPVRCRGSVPGYAGRLLAR